MASKEYVLIYVSKRLQAISKLSCCFRFVSILKPVCKVDRNCFRCLWVHRYWIVFLGFQKPVHSFLIDLINVYRKGTGDEARSASLKQVLETAFRSKLKLITSEVKWFLHHLRHDIEHAINLVVMSLNCTGPDRKKIKLTPSHVSHLLIIQTHRKFCSASPEKPVCESRRISIHVISFCVFSFACILIFLSFLSSCLHDLYLGLCWFCGN